MRKKKVVKQPTVESIRKFLADYGGDGWSILRADALVTHYGFPAEWVKPLVYTHKSTGGKGDLYDSHGKPVASLEGVYSLSVLSRLAAQVGAQTPSYMGRGFQARAYTEGILKLIGEVES